MLRLFILIDCIESSSQLPSGKYVPIWETAEANKLVIFPTLSRRLITPPHVPSPLSTVSKVTYIPQLDNYASARISGTKDIAIMQVTNIPPAKRMVKIVANLISHLL